MLCSKSLTFKALSFPAISFSLFSRISFALSVMGLRAFVLMSAKSFNAFLTSSVSDDESKTSTRFAPLLFVLVLVSCLCLGLSLCSVLCSVLSFMLVSVLVIVLYSVPCSVLLFSTIILYLVGMFLFVPLSNSIKPFCFKRFIADKMVSCLFIPTKRPIHKSDSVNHSFQPHLLFTFNK